MMRHMIDPPEGWKYGFPKELPEDVENVREWLVEQGYPREKLKLASLGTWHWDEEVEEEDDTS